MVRKQKVERPSKEKRLRHREQPKRLGEGTRKAEVYFGLVAFGNQRERADGGDCGRAARGGLGEGIREERNGK